MLYLDYSRKDQDWIPNIHGGRENLETIKFLKHTNVIVYQRFPRVMTIAEKSTAWPKAPRPADHGGLGFGFKWNMGWMHNVLSYMTNQWKPTWGCCSIMIICKKIIKVENNIKPPCLQYECKPFFLYHGYGKADGYS